MIRFSARILGWMGKVSNLVDNPVEWVARDSVFVILAVFNV